MWHLQEVFLRIIRLFALLTLLVFMIGSGFGGVAAAPPPASTTSAQVDRQVWNDLAAAADHRARFVVSMRETTGSGTASAIPAQMALEEPLGVLQRVGAVAAFTAYYGANAIVIEGGLGAIRFLAEWPEVAAIHPYSAGALWEAKRCCGDTGCNRAHHRSRYRPRRDHAPARRPRAGLSADRPDFLDARRSR